jgi:hypothetical protein
MAVGFSPSREGREGKVLGRPVSWARENDNTHGMGRPVLLGRAREGREWPAYEAILFFFF